MVVPFHLLPTPYTSTSCFILRSISHKLHCLWPQLYQVVNPPAYLPFFMNQFMGYWQDWDESPVFPPGRELPPNWSCSQSWESSCTLELINLFSIHHQGSSKPHQPRDTSEVALIGKTYISWAFALTCRPWVIHGPSTCPSYFWNSQTVPHECSTRKPSP